MHPGPGQPGVVLIVWFVAISIQPPVNISVLHTLATKASRWPS